MAQPSPAVESTASPPSDHQSKATVVVDATPTAAHSSPQPVRHLERQSNVSSSAAAHGGGFGMARSVYGAHRRPPRAASQLVEMLVKEPLSDHSNPQHAASLVDQGEMLLGPAAAVAQSAQLSPLDVYDASADPFLRQYWQRKNALPTIWRQQRQQKQHKGGGVSKVGRGGGGAQPSTPAPAASSRPLVGASGTSSGDGGHHDAGSPPKRAVSACDFSASSLSQRSTVSAIAFSEVAVKQAPMEPYELLALRTMLCPKGNWVCNLPTPNCELGWFRKLLEGGLPPTPVASAAPTSHNTRSNSVVTMDKTHNDGVAGTDDDAAAKPSTSPSVIEHGNSTTGQRTDAAVERAYAAHATKTLATMNFNLLEKDATHYGEDHSLTATLINSPRSVVVLLRSGLQPYELLKRPAAFYLKVGEVLSAEALNSRRSRAEADREALVGKLQHQYLESCQRFPPLQVVGMLMPPTLGSEGSTAQVVKKLRDKSEVAFQKLQKRITKTMEMEAARRKFASEKAVAISTQLLERNEKKKKMVAEQSRELSEQLQQRTRTQQLLNEMLEMERHEQARRIEEKHDKVTQRYEELKQQRLEEGAQTREENEKRSQRSRSLLQQREEEERRQRALKEAHHQQRAAEYRARIQEEREAAAKRQDEIEQKQLMFKQRAEENQRRTRETFERRLAEAEERLEEFREREEEQAAIRSVLHAQRETHLKRAIETAKLLEEQTAERALRKREAAEERFAEVKEREKRREAALAEQHMVERETKMHLVDAVRKRNEFDGLVELARMQQRELQVAAFEEGKQEAARTAAEYRTKLRIMHYELGDQGESHRIEVERKQASEIYDIEHPPVHFPVVLKQFQGVSARIDAGQHQRGRSPPTVAPSSSNSSTTKQVKEQKEEGAAMRCTTSAAEPTVTSPTKTPNAAPRPAAAEAPPPADADKKRVGGHSPTAAATSPSSSSPTKRQDSQTKASSPTRVSPPTAKSEAPATTSATASPNAASKKDQRSNAAASPSSSAPSTSVQPPTHPAKSPSPTKAASTTPQKAAAPQVASPQATSPRRSSPSSSRSSSRRSAVSDDDDAYASDFSHHSSPKKRQEVQQPPASSAVATSPARRQQQVPSTGAAAVDDEEFVIDDSDAQRTANAPAKGAAAAAGQPSSSVATNSAVVPANRSGSRQSSSAYSSDRDDDPNYGSDPDFE